VTDSPEQPGPRLIEVGVVAFGFVGGLARCYDVRSDGQRFYVRRSDAPKPPPAVTHVNINPHWLTGLRGR
jgi:hypothetical protein